MIITIKKNVLLFSLATALFGLNAQAQVTVPGGEWPSYNNGYESQRFSVLDQINTSNIDQIGEVCRIQVDGPTAFHAGMVIDDGVLYTSTPLETLALDARTCDVIWKFEYQPEDPDCGGTNRGVALDNGRVFRGTCDGRLIALDAGTGSLLWKHQIANVSRGESTTAVPLVWQNRVYMGIAGSELGIRGRIMAYDAASGEEIWRFHTIPMDGDIGAETWERPETAKTGGGGVWGVMSLDVSSGELFVPVGNPWPDIDMDYRPGDNLFTNSVVVLNAFTGELNWWHQISPADWQDFDLSAAPTLFRAGRTDYVAMGGKDGYLTLVNRDTREEVFRTPVTTVEHLHDRPSVDGTRMCPGFAGGIEWNGAALDRLNDNLIVGAADICFILTLGEEETYIPGTLQFGGTVMPDGEATGWITALDKLSGEIKWQYAAEKPVIAGITPTAGGITLAGDLAGNFLVFNSASGELLLKRNIGGAMAGGVTTYELDGRQYIAVNAGNISRNAFGDVGLPSVVIMTLNPEQDATSLDASSAANQGTANGRRLFSQVCTACHGGNGDMITDKGLSNISERMSFEEIVGKIKQPVTPMPSLFPELLTEQDVIDLSTYIVEAL